jgi:hypothetical protein
MELFLLRKDVKYTFCIWMKTPGGASSMGNVPASKNSNGFRSICSSVLFTTVLLLSGCGGGGGGGSNSSGSVKGNVPKETPASKNSPPVALDESISTNQDTATGTLTLDASDINGDRLSYKIVSNGVLGTAVISDASSGVYEYTPKPGQFGVDTFTFSASDATTTSNTATVTVTINGKPQATGSCSTVEQGNQKTGLAGKLKGTDPESPTMLMYKLLNPNGSVAGLTLTTARGGTVTITNPTNGEYTYKADPGPGDKRGRDTFRYQVSDPEGAVASATETVIVDHTVMPLGDSITNGVDSTGGSVPQKERIGYRRSLHNRLTNARYMIDFVGSRKNGSIATPPLADDDHEGHSGWTAFNIAWGRAMDGSDGVFAWLEQNPADYILLHIGTNDLINTEDDVAAILDEIDRWEKSANGNPVTVVLARIIDFAPNNPDVGVFNTAVRKMVKRRTNDDIIIVNQQTGAGLDYTVRADMSDNVHPSASGYEKMADVWFDGLTPLLDKCP